MAPFLVLIMAVLSLSGIARAAELSLGWEPSPEPDIAGYKVYWGTSSGRYGPPKYVHRTTCRVRNLADGTTYYFAVKAYDTEGLESRYSKEMIYVPGCAYSVLPTTVDFSAHEGIGAISVATEPNCTWNSKSYAYWITIETVDARTVHCSVSPNWGSPRRGFLTVAGMLFEVTQEGLNGHSFNLLENGGFESGDLSGWTVKKGTAAVGSEARSVGNFGARIDAKGRIYQEFDTVPGREYYVSGRVRVDQEIIKPTWGGLVIWISDDAGNVIGSSKYVRRSNCPKGSWKRLKFSFRAATAKTGLVFRKFSDGQFVAAVDDFVVSRFPILQ